MSVETVPASGVAAYAEYLKDQLAAEDRRKASLEQRGLAVLSSSGGLVTLLFALGALSTKAQTFVLDHAAEVLLVCAAALFVAAAMCALSTNAPVTYSNVSPEAVRSRLREEPARDETAARRDIALTTVKVLRNAKTRNQLKARLLFVALVLEVAAVTVVAVAVAVAVL